jgi:hypothetical protein
MFLDERGTGLRVTWHPERDLVVLSVWQGDSCIGTFRMSVQDVPRLSGLLAAALGDWVDQTSLIPSTSGAPGTGGGPGSSVGPGTGVGPGTSGGPGTAGGGPGVGRDPEAGGGGSAVAGGPTVMSAKEGGGPRGEGREGRDHEAGGSKSGMGDVGYSLSVQQRLRLSRPVLKLRGLQDRRRRPA